MTQEHMTAAEYRREIAGEKKPNKYCNRKTVVDGMMFDSQKEASYYWELKQLMRAGQIMDFFRQVPFLLHDGYFKGEEWIKPIYYVADFVVIPHRFSAGLMQPIEVHEVKGKWTRTAIDKRKMFEKRYPEYKLVII